MNFPKQLFRSLTVAAALWLIGCAKESTVDPLVGWKPVGNSGYVNDSGQAYIKDIPFGNSISEDIEQFIKELPIEKSKYGDRSQSYWIDFISLFENESGERAVKIHIPLNGTHMNYVLFYNKSNVRMKVTKFSSGRYAS